MATTVEKIMVSPVVTTTLDSTTGYVRELMERKRVSAIPIVSLKDKKINLLGIVTNRDLRGVKDESTDVVFVMTSRVKSVPKDTPLHEAARKMIENDMHHLVVVENEKVVGIISSMDFVKAVADGMI